MAEVDFQRASTGQIVHLLLTEGCVLLRDFTDGRALAEVYDLAEQVYRETEEVHVYARDLRARRLPMLHEPLFTARHCALLDSLFGPVGFSVSEETVVRCVDPRVRDGRWLPPLNPHLDAFSHAPEFTINFWVPLQACGSHAPSLAVVRLPLRGMPELTGYDRSRPPAKSGPRVFLPRFDPYMRELFAGEAQAVNRFREELRERIWTPEYGLGDAMILTNWTFHYTHATPAMHSRRMNLELRFSGAASLEEILAMHETPGSVSEQ